MKILRKLFSTDEEWSNNTIAEQERNKVRDAKLKKLNLHDRVVAETMWDDTDSAGRERYGRNQAVSGIVGGTIGYAVGSRAGKAIGKSTAGKIGGVLVGRSVARFATNKKNRRIAEKIWDQGDKEQMDYIEANAKKKKQLEKEYKPIGWRVDRKGRYLENPYPYSGASLESRVKARIKEELEQNERPTNKNKKKNKKED